jgi:hypothetical protein
MPPMTNGLAWGAVLVLLSAAPGCSSAGSATGSWTNEDAMRQVGVAYCARLTQCHFGSQYPSEAACVDSFVSGLSQAKRSEPSACSKQQVDTCVSDINFELCGSVTAGSFPPSCTAC